MLYNNISNKQDSPLILRNLHPKRSLSETYLPKGSIEKLQKFRKLDSSINDFPASRKNHEDEATKKSSCELQNQRACSNTSKNICPEPIRKCLNTKPKTANIEEALKKMKPPTTKSYKKQLEKMRMLSLSQEKHIQDYVMTKKKSSPGSSPPDDANSLNESPIDSVLPKEDKPCNLSVTYNTHNFDQNCNDSEFALPEDHGVTDTKEPASLNYPSQRGQHCQTYGANTSSQWNNICKVNEPYQNILPPQINLKRKNVGNQTTDLLPIKNASLTSLSHNEAGDKSSLTTTQDFQPITSPPQYVSRSVSEPLAFEPYQQQQYQRYLRYQQWLRQRYHYQHQKNLNSNNYPSSFQNYNNIDFQTKSLANNVPAVSSNQNEQHPSSSPQNNYYNTNNQINDMQSTAETTQTNDCNQTDEYNSYNTQMHGYDQSNSQILPQNNLQRSQSLHNSSQINPQYLRMYYHRMMQYRFALQNRAVLQNRLNRPINAQPHQSANGAIENNMGQKIDQQNAFTENFGTENRKFDNQDNSLNSSKYEQSMQNNMINIHSEPLSANPGLIHNVDGFFNLGDGKENESGAFIEANDKYEGNSTNQDVNPFIDPEQFFQSFSKEEEHDLNGKSKQDKTDFMFSAPDNMFTLSNIFNEDRDKANGNYNLTEIPANLESIFRMDSW